MPKLKGKHTAPGHAADGGKRGAHRVVHAEHGFVNNTKQASDQEASAWDVPYSRVQFGPAADTLDVGNPYADDALNGNPGNSPRREGALPKGQY